ncbi:hypothetical protein [Hydrogenophaga sp. 2FB]|uniref:hypothetical protein n=1 Tax=Hydrogenophaga sp. 2FB TaxID=2502187 RepID=UPI0010F551C6|nr:hypothetical protein [Hydrogenophaga sp. 2FB]
MTFIASLELLNAIKNALWAPERRKPIASPSWANRVVEEGWLTLTEFGDRMEFEDPRLYGLDRHWNEACAAFGLPVRFATSKPRSHRSDAMLLESISALDAAAMMIRLQGLGFTVDPSALAGILAKKLVSQRRLSESECLVYFEAKTRGRDLLRIRTDPPNLLSATESLINQSGYRIKWCSTGDSAEIEVRGPKFQPQKTRANITCDYCGYERTSGDLESSLAHRAYHHRIQRCRDPKPLAAFAHRLATSATADVVTNMSPKWAHKEMYERAVMFKREMGFDFPQWTDPPAKGRTTEEGVGYLLADSREPATIAGACAFRQRDGTWTLDWAWLAPKYRRTGVLQRYWTRFVAAYGDFDLEYPLSDAMRDFVLKHGTAVQQTRLRNAMAGR